MRSIVLAMLVVASLALAAGGCSNSVEALVADGSTKDGAKDGGGGGGGGGGGTGSGGHLGSGGGGGTTAPGGAPGTGGTATGSGGGGGDAAAGRGGHAQGGSGGGGGSAAGTGGGAGAGAGATGAGGTIAPGGRSGSGGIAAGGRGGATSGSGGAATGGAGSGGRGGTSGAGGRPGAGGAAGTTGGGGAGANACQNDAACGAGAYCDFGPNDCGTKMTMPGTCKTRPISCTTNVDPVCGCDGKVYSNPCEAAVAGHDASDAGGCPPPTGMFPCGPRFCAKGTSYCKATVGGALGLSVPGQYACTDLPAACLPTPSCACLGSPPTCTLSAGGDITVTIQVP